MSALQVFQEDRHPSMIRGPGRPKEGVSLFGLLEPFVASVPGRQALRRWLLQPSRDLGLLSDRLDAVEVLHRSRNDELLRELHRELREVRDLAALLRRIFSNYHFDNAQDWRGLTTTLEHMSAAFALVRRDRAVAALAPLCGAKGLAADVAAAGNMLSRFVDLDGQPAGGAEVHICEGVDTELDAVREQYANIDVHLTEVARLERRRLLQEHPDGDWAADVLVFHYFPQIGFHASVPNPLADEVCGGDGDAESMERLKRDAPAPAEDWRYQFAGSGRLFYKCRMAARLDAEIGDLLVAARELELELLLGVVERLRRLEPRLCRAAQLLAEFDVLAGFAAAAKEHRWTRPAFSRDPGVLRIVQGRHPLVESLLAAHHGFVPNHTELGLPLARKGDDGAAPRVAPARVQVVTGANLAGKSVYLKQVGVIVLMAQVGCFVPADEAELGLCDLLLSRIQGAEGAAVRFSSFGIDLTQVSLALKHATDSSLLLLDEFGKGTHPADGVALLGATVRHLCRWSRGPKAVITTHFTEVFRFGLLAQDEPGLQICSMRVLPPEEGGGGVAYLYQLVPGVAARSFGIECAKKAGMDASVLQRATEILESLERGVEVPPPRSGPCAEAAAKADAQDSRRRGIARLVVDRLCALSPGDEAACRALLGFVWSQQAHLRDLAE
ncbi:unnamed protein product [Prorocentrum cordatum]|uniref:DNA mismatch repair proteins mutS family domain-containing protein n=1 Tax=Prorocentrum cordatum TaxID=2364126 RepID=A0ABN9PU09_9DINO|nr:unnamed protein product [Polarella glacialis]